MRYVRRRRTAACRTFRSTTVTVERPQNPEHGDFATSTPMKLARVMRRNPFDIAEAIASSTATGGILESAGAVRPGFVNLRLNPAWLAEQVDVIRQARRHIR